MAGIVTTGAGDHGGHGERAGGDGEPASLGQSQNAVYCGSLLQLSGTHCSVVSLMPMEEYPSQHEHKQLSRVYMVLSVSQVEQASLASGLAAGALVGLVVGASVGLAVGALVGLAVGEAVGQSQNAV